MLTKQEMERFARNSREASRPHASAAAKAGNTQELKERIDLAIICLEDAKTFEFCARGREAEGK